VTYLNRYSLQSVLYPGGLTQFYLLSSLSGLVMPTKKTLSFAGEVTERVDVQAGENNIETVDYSYIEDYGTYPEGFWHKVLQGTTEIQTTVDQGAGPLHYAWHSIPPQNNTQSEISLLSGAIRRQGTKLQGISRLLTLQSVPLSTIFQYALSWAEQDTPGNSWCTIQNILDAMALAMGSSLTTTASSVVGNDFRFSSAIDWTTTPTSWSTPQSLYMILANVTGVGIGLWAADQWMSRYATAYDLLIALCKTFGWVPSYTFDVANNRHVLMVIPRGSANTAATIGSGTVLSNYYPSTGLLVNNIGITRDSGLVNNTDKPPGESYFSAGTWTAGQAPPGFQPDMSVNVLFEVAGFNYSDFDMLYQAAQPLAVGSVDVWDYTANAWYSVAHPHTPLLTMQQAAAYYYWSRFQAQKSMYERRVYGLNLAQKILDKTTINDGVVSRNYYLTELRKDVRTNQMYYIASEV